MMQVVSCRNQFSNVTAMLARQMQDDASSFLPKSFSNVSVTLARQIQDDASSFLPKSI